MNRDCCTTSMTTSSNPAIVCLGLKSTWPVLGTIALLFAMVFNVSWLSLASAASHSLNSSGTFTFHSTLALMVIVFSAVSPSNSLLVSSGFAGSIEIPSCVIVNVFSSKAVFTVISAVLFIPEFAGIVTVMDSFSPFSLPSPDCLSMFETSEEEGMTCHGLLEIISNVMASPLAETISP